MSDKSDNNQPSKLNADAKYYQGATKETLGKTLGILVV
jgi:hypothetical protein